MFFSSDILDLQGYNITPKSTNFDYPDVSLPFQGVQGGGVPIAIDVGVSPIPYDMGITPLMLAHIIFRGVQHVVKGLSLFSGKVHSHTPSLRL